MGGGTGLVPLLRLVTFLKKTDDVTVIMGAKMQIEVFFESLAKKLLAGTRHQVIVVTEDGSYGEKGLVTDVMDKLFKSDKFDAIYTCGPEKMMYKVVQLLLKTRSMLKQALKE